VIEHLTLGAFVVALSMGLAALCAFLWGATTGAFRGGESIKHQVLRAEGLSGDEPRTGHERPEA